MSVLCGCQGACEAQASMSHYGAVWIFKYDNVCAAPNFRWYQDDISQYATVILISRSILNVDLCY